MKALDQEAFAERSAALNERRAQAVSRRKELEEDITRRSIRKEEIARYFERLEGHGPLTEFLDEDWRALVEYRTGIFMSFFFHSPIVTLQNRARRGMTESNLFRRLTGNELKTILR